MGIGSEVCSRCEGGIFVSVEVEYEGGLLCCGRKYLRFIFVEKQLKIGSGDG